MSVILDPRSESYKRFKLYDYFDGGLDSEEVVQALSSDFPAMTTQEVEAWFARFKAGNMEIGENISINVEGIVVDRSVRLKRGLESAEQADGEPPARMNPISPIVPNREVDEEGGTHQHPKGNGDGVTNQAVAQQQQAAPHDVPAVAVNQNPANRGILQIEDSPVRQDQGTVAIPPQHPVIQPEMLPVNLTEQRKKIETVAEKLAALDSGPKTGSTHLRIMAEPVKPIYEKKWFTNGCGKVEPPTPEVDVSKWTPEETADWVEQSCPHRKDINAERLVKEGLNGTLLEDFVIKPARVDLMKLLNLNYTEHWLLARQAAFLVNRSNRFTYPERVRDYQRDLEIWKKQNSQYKGGEEEKGEKEMEHGAGLERGLMRGAKTCEDDDYELTAAEKIEKRRKYMAKVERFMAMEFGPKYGGSLRRIMAEPVRPIYEKKLFTEGYEFEEPERYKEDVSEWTPEDTVNWIHLICPHRWDIDEKRIVKEGLSGKLVQEFVARPARVAKLLDLNYTERMLLARQAAVLLNRSNRMTYSERVRDYYRDLDIWKKRNSQ